MFELFVITLGAFLAGVVNAAFATGGVYVLIFATTSVLPITVAVPLQGVFSVGSLVGRIALFWRHINWPMIYAVAAGGLVGVGLGALVFRQLGQVIFLPNFADIVIGIGLGSLVLIFIWLPFTLERLPFRHPFLYLGSLHAFIATVFGIGGLLQPFIIKTQLTKMGVTGTLAGMMLSLDIMKFVGYSVIGFSFIDYLPHILLATAAGFAGAWVGKRLGAFISEELFRTIFKIMVSVFALRLIIIGLRGLL